MISRQLIRQTLRKKLLTVDGLPDKNHLAWENRKFQPPDTSMWIRETLIPILESLIGNETISWVGYVQYDIFTPIGSGTEEAEQLAAKIGDAFKPATSLNDPIPVQIVRCETRQGDGGQRLSAVGRRPAVDIWYQLPVQVMVQTFSYK